MQNTVSPGKLVEYGIKSKVQKGRGGKGSMICMNPWQHI